MNVGALNLIYTIPGFSVGSISEDPFAVLGGCPENSAEAAAKGQYYTFTVDSHYIPLSLVEEVVGSPSISITVTTAGSWFSMVAPS